MKTSAIVKLLTEAGMKRNGFAFETNTHRFDLYSTEEAGRVWYVAKTPLTENRRADYSESLQLYSLKELRQAINTNLT